ncbi:uncharacterized protein PHA67_007789 isoform 2-T2 [Liasis olivaceus]
MPCSKAIKRQRSRSVLLSAVQNQPHPFLADQEGENVNRAECLLKMGKMRNLKRCKCQQKDNGDENNYPRFLQSEWRRPSPGAFLACWQPFEEDQG